MDELPSVHLYGIFQSVVDGIRNKCMPDRDFQEVGDGAAKIGEIFKVQVMACIKAKTCRGSNAGRFHIRTHSCNRMFGEKSRIFFGI